MSILSSNFDKNIILASYSKILKSLQKSPKTSLNQSNNPQISHLSNSKHHNPQNLPKTKIFTAVRFLPNKVQLNSNQYSINNLPPIPISPYIILFFFF